MAVLRKVTELFPRSVHAHDSLSDALEAAGDRSGALTTTRRGLELLSTEDLAPNRRKELQDLLESRLKRLGRLSGLATND